MPITPSHAVVALPFLGTRLVPAAIAVGAMTPDLPLFVRGTPLSYGVTHSFEWLPVTVVAALALLLVWRTVLRPATRELSPQWLAGRLPSSWDAGAAAGVRETFSRRGPSEPSWRAAGLLAIALVIGVASHIVWDLFTHEGRWGVAVLPVLADPWGPLRGFAWLQHGSSVVGGLILTVWAARWIRRKDARPVVARTVAAWVRWVWWASLPVMLTAAWLAGLSVLGPLTPEFTVAHLGYRVLPPACAVWAALTLALCVTVQVRRPGR